MRGYKVNKEGLIEEVYDLAPEGSKDKYNGEEGLYTETAINKLIAQNVRYREFIEVKAEKRRLDIDLQDTQEELKRLVKEDRSNKSTIKDLRVAIKDKQAKADKMQEDLINIKRGIDSVLGGAE